MGRERERGAERGGENEERTGNKERKDNVSAGLNTDASKKTHLQRDPVVDTKTEKLRSDVEDTNVEEDVGVGEVDLASDLHRTERDEEVRDSGVDHSVLLFLVELSVQGREMRGKVVEEREEREGGLAGASVRWSRDLVVAWTDPLLAQVR
jgi:hypothetical protein